MVDELMGFLGFTFDDGKTQSILSRLPMLGNIECFDSMGEMFTVEAKPERLKAISEIVRDILKAESLPSGLASSIRGKLLNLAATRPGRTGRLPIPFINEIADGKATGWSIGIQRDLLYVLDELQMEHKRDYPLCATLDIGPRVWSDASYSVCHDTKHMWVCTIVANRSQAEGIVWDTSPELFCALVQRETQITAGELMGIIGAFIFFAEQLRGSSAIAFCDNMASLQCAINGSSTSIDLCAMAHMLALRLNALSVRLFIEYVQTLSNIADGGSRVGITCKEAEAANIVLREVACPILPKGFPFTNSNESSFWY